MNAETMKYVVVKSNYGRMCIGYLESIKITEEYGKVALLRQAKDVGYPIDAVSLSMFSKEGPDFPEKYLLSAGADLTHVYAVEEICEISDKAKESIKKITRTLEMGGNNPISSDDEINETYQKLTEVYAYDEFTVDQIKHVIPPDLIWKELHTAISHSLFIEYPKGTIHEFIDKSYKASDYIRYTLKSEGESK